MSLIALRTTKLGDPTLTCTTASSQQGSRVIKVFQRCAPASTTASSLRCFSAMPLLDRRERKKRCCVLSRYTVNAFQWWIFHGAAFIPPLLIVLQQWTKKCCYEQGGGKEAFLLSSFFCYVLLCIIICISLLVETAWEDFLCLFTPSSSSLLMCDNIHW